jgi:hypothetical protein
VLDHTTTEFFFGTGDVRVRKTLFWTGYTTWRVWCPCLIALAFE